MFQIFQVGQPVQMRRKVIIHSVQLTLCMSCSSWMNKCYPGFRHQKKRKKKGWRKRKEVKEVLSQSGKRFTSSVSPTTVRKGKGMPEIGSALVVQNIGPLDYHCYVGADDFPCLTFLPAYFIHLSLQKQDGSVELNKARNLAAVSCIKGIAPAYCPTTERSDG